MKSKLTMLEKVNVKKTLESFKKEGILILSMQDMMQDMNAFGSVDAFMINCIVKNKIHYNYFPKQYKNDTDFLIKLIEQRNDILTQIFYANIFKFEAILKKYPEEINKIKNSKYLDKDTKDEIKLFYKKQNESKVKVNKDNKEEYDVLDVLDTFQSLMN